jgi:phosphate/sulfate permease
MKAFKNTIIFCLATYAIIGIGVFFYNNTEQLAMVGLSGLLLSILFLLIGIILCIPVSTRNLGKGLLLSAGISLVIGLSICSVYQIKI